MSDSIAVPNVGDAIETRSGGIADPDSVPEGSAPEAPATPEPEPYVEPAPEEVEHNPDDPS